VKYSLRIAVTSIVLSVVTAALAAERRQLVYSPSLGAHLGVGWDTLSGRPANNVCVTGTEEHSPFSDKQISVQRIHDTYSLNKLLRITLEGSASFGSAKAKSSSTAEYQTTIHSSGVNWLLNASVTNGIKYLAGENAPLQLQEWAASLLKRDPNRMLKKSVHAGSS
jgi:hypothetical protein